eukprot:SAG22_NODE_2214_length_2828_cov_2.586295_4_plen_136_part_00
MKYEWHLQMPSVIISVTGNATPFTLRPKYLELFTTALLNATRTTNAWIVTGGCGAGIMKLVGDAFARYKRLSPVSTEQRLQLSLVLALASLQPPFFLAVVLSRPFLAVVVQLSYGQRSADRLLAACSASESRPGA